VSDITYILVGDGFAYLSLVTDAYSRKIVGFCESETLSAVGSLKALSMALKACQDTSELIHHSDRGEQYCCQEYVSLLKNNNIQISMTQSGDPLENAIAERVNAGPPFRFVAWRDSKIWDSLPISKQGGLAYGAAECQLYARIQDLLCFTCLRLEWKFGDIAPLARV